MRELIMICISMTLAIAVIIISIALVIRKITPLIKIQIKIHRLTKAGKSLKKYWKSIEIRFAEDEEFRNSFTDDPKKIAGFFTNTDAANDGTTDFARGLTAYELAALFSGNPELINERTEEFLEYANGKYARKWRKNKRKARKYEYV